jgi:hypothetical protein
MKPSTKSAAKSPPPIRGTFDDTILCEPYLLGGDSPVWRFFCEWCGEFHTHGVGEGRRVAHCSDRGRKRGSPYRWGGYYLKLDPQFEKEST